MGLFSNKKKLCPICGNPTPRLLATKIDGTPICGDCNAKIDLPQGGMDGMTIDKFQNYLSLYEANRNLLHTFTETYSYTFGFLAGVIVLDTTHRMFRLNNLDNSWVFEAANLKSFRILEDSRVLYEGTLGALKYRESDVPERVNAMSFQISQYMMQRREYERMKERERQDREEGKNVNASIHYRPADLPVPFRHFHVELELDHPYWKTHKWQFDGPIFSTTCPSIDSYLSDYNKKVEDLHMLALNLMQILNPEAQEVTVGSNWNGGFGQ